MDTGTQRAAVWAGPLLMVFFGLGFWVVAGLLPPPSPGMSAHQIVDFYSEHKTRIRIGLVICMLAAGFAFPFSSVIAMQLRRITGTWNAMALTQLLAGGCSALTIVFPMFTMSAAAFRPEIRNPEITLALNDQAWLPFAGFTACPIFQAAACAIVIFQDRRERPVYARWVGYFNVWAAILFFPGGLVVCFLSGPFAFNGLLAFWLPLVVFTIWTAVMTVTTLKAISAEEEEFTASQTLAPAGSAPVELQK